MKMITVIAVMITYLTSLQSSASVNEQGETGNSVPEKRYIIKFKENKKSVVKNLAKNRGGKIKFKSKRFISASFGNKGLSEVKEVMNNSDILFIEEDHVRRQYSAVYEDSPGNPQTEQITPYSIYQSNVEPVTFNPDAGIKVCVIDSGLDQNSQDFNWENISGQDDDSTGSWNVVGSNSHGTHVAGTIGASNNDVGVIGMAPGVSMHIIKVFGDDGWAYSSSLADAVERCTDAGADIINMSLGGENPSRTSSEALSAFRNQGGLAIAAAGNDGDDIRRFPSGYVHVMMVGSNDANNDIAETSVHPSCTVDTINGPVSNDFLCVEVAAAGVDVWSTVKQGSGALTYLTVDDVDYEHEAMENKGSVTAETYFMGIAESVDDEANGKICLIDRGTTSFLDKAMICEESGGVGAIIINNVSGLLYGTLGDEIETTIPVVGVALEDREAIIAATETSIDMVDIDYARKSGTSMATPAVAGIAALVWSNHPECSGEHIRLALSATATDAGDIGKDVYFGHGIVNADAAERYLAENGCDLEVFDSFGLSLELGFSSRRKQWIELLWNIQRGDSVDIYVNDELVDMQAEDTGTYRGMIDSQQTHTFEVCQSNSERCSSQIVYEPSH